ncbi:MAG: hypothetical protein ACYCQK_03985 [Acidiferrobacteraceae bacterium]
MRPDPNAFLADPLTDLRSSHETFSQLYRHLLELRFPLDVAEILELRSLLNQLIDQEKDVQEDPALVMELHRIEFDALGIAQPAHKDRLARLMVALRSWHVRHRNASRAQENRLRKALADNHRARKRSIQYGKACLVPALALFALSAVAGWHAWLIKGVALLLGYLFCDHFHSLVALGKQHRQLDGKLAQLVAARVPSLNANSLLRQVALILGYGRVKGVEPFMLEDQAERLRASA